MIMKLRQSLFETVDVDSLYSPKKRLGGMQADLAESHLTWAVSRRNRHGGDISPVPLLIVTDEILLMLERNRMNVVVNADD